MRMPVRSPLTPADRTALLSLARGTIAGRLGLPAPEPLKTAAFDTAAGAFVTVFVDRELRGCIGMTEGTRPLSSIVVHCAAAAAFEDPRFPPVAREELTALSLEISVLSPLEPLDDVASIIVGRDGLVVEHGWRRGLLLPQVAEEHGWSVDEFLHHTCIKAGLPSNAWQRGALLYRFEADVFGEIERGG